MYCFINGGEIIMSETVQIKSDCLEIEVNPKRGNIISKCNAFGKEWMYINQENYESDERPRCGCPVLFPYMGSLPQDELHLDNVIYPAFIHGVVHTNDWRIRKKDATSASFQTESNATTFASFPFSFKLETNIQVVENVVSYEMIIHNSSQTTMPCDCGFHPFFQIQKLRDVKLIINELEYPWDDQLYHDVTTQGKFIEGVKQITCISGDDQFTLKTVENLPHLFLWSGKPDSFLVIEPWTAPWNAINEGNQLFKIEPNGSRRVAWEISFDKLHILTKHVKGDF